jgi:hypothetical protein
MSITSTTSYSTFHAFFSDNIMADVASKQQTTALFLSTTVTRTRRHTELTKKNWQTWRETCAVPLVGWSASGPGRFTPPPPTETRVHPKYDAYWASRTLPDVLEYKNISLVPDENEPQFHCCPALLQHWLNSPWERNPNCSIDSFSSTINATGTSQGHNLWSSVFKTREIDGRTA